MPRATAVMLTMMVGAGGAAAGQRLSGAAGLAAADHRVDAGTGVEVSRGPVIQAGVLAAFGARWTVSLDAMVGALSADGSWPDRDVAELRGALGFRATSWLRLEAGYGSRVYSAPIASQRWNTASLAAEGTLNFANARLSGTGRFAWLPSVTVTELDSPDLAFATAAGVEYRPGALGFGLSYWLERYDFPTAAGVTRSEQLSGLMVRATWTP